MAEHKGDLGMTADFTKDFAEVTHIKGIALLVAAFVVVVVFLSWRKDYL